MSELKKVLIVANIKKSNLENLMIITKSVLENRGIASYVVSPSYFKVDNHVLTDFDDGYKHNLYDLIIAIGGDGTFLYTARTFLDFNIPILGINLGRLGFLMEVNPDDIENAIEKIITNKIDLKKRILLDVNVQRNNKQTYFFSFLNDAVVSKGVLSRMVEMQVSLDMEILAQYRADGLIVSTPTGSTAYNLAAGGPILTPDMEAMIISPICPHSLGVRPLVTSKDKTLLIKIISGEEDTSITIDGQENFYLKKDDCIIISSSNRYIRIYDYGEGQFFSTLRGKMGWNVC